MIARPQGRDNPCSLPWEPLRWGEMLRRAFVLPILLYQRLLSPLLPSSCRFYPSCSEYARRAILKYGLFKGGWLAIRRIARCHPLSEGGYDPPP